MLAARRTDSLVSAIGVAENPRLPFRTHEHEKEDPDSGSERSGLPSFQRILGEGANSLDGGVHEALQGIDQ